MVGWSKTGDAGIRAWDSFCEWMCCYELLCKWSSCFVKDACQSSQAPATELMNDLLALLEEDCRDQLVIAWWIGNRKKRAEIDE